MRAGYPESKRCGEALCQAYIRQKGMDVVIPRFTRSYGPTMLDTDTKAISRFSRKVSQVKTSS
jgi:nucleoside-diphosphate-sugar epimerase